MLLLFANTVFAGNRPSSFDAQPQDLFSQGHGPLLLAFNAAIVKHQRMEIAVASMEDIGHPQPSFRAEAINLAQELAVTQCEG